MSRILIVFNLFLCLINSLNATCGHWGDTIQIGTINPKIIRESSGIEWTKSYPNTLFHINDSGDGTNVYLSDLVGNISKKIKIKNFFSWDSEDISIGPCPQSTDECFFYGDIGDGRIFGAQIKIGYLPLKKLLANNPVFENKLKVHLPGGNNDLEGMAVHPNGDLYLTSKDPGLTKFFKIEKINLNKKSTNAKIIATLNHKILGDNLEKSLTTGLDISDNGKSILLLTYENIIQIDYDLSKINTGEVIDLTPYTQIINAPILPQQEAITYIGNYALLYTTEADRALNPILRIDCKE